MVSKNYKIILIGDQSVGKTSAIYRFCDKQYKDWFKATITCDIRKKYINLDGEEVCLEIWDTAGTERFNAVSLLSYRNIDGIILMYDITSLNSFNTLKKRIEYIKNNVSSDIVKVLVGNKFDAPEEKREVNFKTGLQLANELDVPFFEASSKANINIEEAFLILARNIRQFKLLEKLRILDEEKRKIENDIVKLEEEKKKMKRSYCCNISDNTIFLNN